MNTERIAAHALLESIRRTTPGGIQREQFVRRRHPIKALLSVLPFIALVVFAAIACLIH